MIYIYILRGKSRCPWLIHSDIETIQSLFGSAWTVGHCFREANQVADILSKLGVQGSSSVTYSFLAELPRPARGALGLDKGGCPVIRIRVVRN